MKGEQRPASGTLLSFTYTPKIWRHFPLYIFFLYRQQGFESKISFQTPSGNTKKIIWDLATFVPPTVEDFINRNRGVSGAKIWSFHNFKESPEMALGYATDTAVFKTDPSAHLIDRKQPKIEIRSDSVVESPSAHTGWWALRGCWISWLWRQYSRAVYHENSWVLLGNLV